MIPDRKLSAFALVTLAVVILYVSEPLGENFYIVGDTMTISLSFAAVLSGLYAYRPHGFGSMQGRALLFLTLGTFFWFLGEFSWGYYEIFLGTETPVASIADVFWIIGYPLFLLGLYYIFRVSSNTFSKGRLAVLAVLIAGMSLSMLYLAVPTLAGAGMSAEEKASTAGYVIGDMLLMSALMVVISSILGGKLTKPWIIILAGLFLSTIADTYYMNFQAHYETGNLIDILWNLDYLLMVLGFIYHRETVEGIIKAASGGKRGSKEAGK